MTCCRRIFIVAALTAPSVAFTACGSEDPNVSGTAIADCADQSVRESVAVNKQTPLGFSAMDVMNGRLTSSGPLTWRPVDSNVAVVGNLNSAATRYRLNAEQAEETATYIHGVNGVCYDRLEVPVSWEFATDDDQLNEAGEGLLIAMTSDRVELASDMPADAIQGTLEIAPAPGMSEPTFRLSIVWQDEAPTGSVAITAEATDGSKLARRTLAELGSN